MTSLSLLCILNQTFHKFYFEQRKYNVDFKKNKVQYFPKKKEIWEICCCCLCACVFFLGVNITSHFIIIYFLWWFVCSRLGRVYCVTPRLFPVFFLFSTFSKPSSSRSYAFPLEASPHLFHMVERVNRTRRTYEPSQLEPRLYL